MKLTQFQEMAINIDKQRQLLTLNQNGVMFDNGFRDIGSGDTQTLENSYQGIFETIHIEGHYTGDFVWNHGSINIYKPLCSGKGHPGLTSQAVTDCAGMIDQGIGITFHSGHFHPKADNALHFMVDFINNSLKKYRQDQQSLKSDALFDDLFDIEKREFASEEELLTFLCEEFPITVYYDDSEDATKTTTFAELYAHVMEFKQFKSDDIDKKQKTEAILQQQQLKQQKETLVTDLLKAGTNNLNTYFFGKKGGETVEFEQHSYRVPTKIANTVKDTQVQQQYKDPNTDYSTFKQTVKTTLRQEISNSTNKGRSPKTIAFYEAAKSADSDLETSIATYR